MTVWHPTELQLRDTGSLKWTGMKTADGQETMGAWVAEMDFATAPPVEEALVSSIKNGLLGYPPRWADEESINALVSFLERRTGWAVNPGWVRSHSSVLGALHTTIEELTRPGSAIVVPTPNYMPFLTIPGGHDRELIEVPSLHSAGAADPQKAWSLDLEGIEAALAKGAGLLILCNPWNPTGRVLSVPELEELNRVVSKYDALIFSDEIHAPLVYGDPASMVSYASLGDAYSHNTVTAVAASKAWNVAGLPASQVIVPNAELRERWDLAHPRDHATTLGSVAAIAAYTDGDEWLAEVIATIDANVRLLDEALRDTAVDYSRPQGTYLNWLGFDAYALDRTPQKVLLDDYAVATNEGVSLGTGYEQWVRVNAAMSRGPWEETVGRIADFASRAPLK
ncbi:aminotransferase class I/II-fold pyridoxal phosphate-dependent enzyme [Actinomycetaceae bacterium MB13-C1-2]|nr:aminotransferase class I/II-fold pyridoxal phosphate-dependent enzyme [Actinomycetaceae bacterium MB13-C1-2]